MPLKKGKSQKIFQANLSELLDKYGKTGKIGYSKPESMAKAKKQALAIAYSKQREAVSQSKRKARIKALK